LTDEVRQAPPPDPVLSEYWVRLPDTGADAALRDVWAARWHHGLWQVQLAAREYFRDNPLGLELKQRMDTALLSVPGVTSARNKSWETWDVTGSPTGEALCRAAADVVDDLMPQMLAALGEQ
jgi:hypothetical protein